MLAVATALPLSLLPLPAPFVLSLCRQVAVVPSCMAHVVSIRLHGFKSVGGEWLEVGLKRRLNAIVGPNGLWQVLSAGGPLLRVCGAARTLGPPSLSNCANSDCSEVRGLLLAVLPTIRQPEFCQGCANADRWYQPVIALQMCWFCVRLQSGSKTHTVVAVLTPDGSRAYKVGGRSARQSRLVRDGWTGRATGGCRRQTDTAS